MKFIETFCAGLCAVLVFAVSLQGIGYTAEKDGGFVAYSSPPGAPGPALFSHQVHGPGGAGYPCIKCHTSTSDKTMMVTMDGIRQGRVCGSCHDGQTRGPRGRSVAAPVQDCPACHMPAGDIVIALNRMDPVAFSHVRHLAVDPARKVSRPFGFSCRDCHPVPFERDSKGRIGMEVPHESGGCAQCHNGKKRRDGMLAAFAANTRCLTCHKSAAL